MLKISIIESATRRQLVLEGKLVAPWTDELKSICQDVASDLNHRQLVVELHGVTVISADGEDALLALMMQGARFRGSGVFTKEILKQLSRKARNNEQETKTTL